MKNEDWTKTIEQRCSTAADRSLSAIREGDGRMTDAALANIIREAIVKSIRDFDRDRVAELHDQQQGLVEQLADALNRVAVLEQRLQASEERGLAYRGIHAAGHAYHCGDAVTFDGSLWIATTATTATPGKGESGWQLAVKRGRDAREFREAR